MQENFILRRICDYLDRLLVATTGWLFLRHGSRKPGNIRQPREELDGATWPRGYR